MTNFQETLQIKSTLSVSEGILSAATYPTIMDSFHLLQPEDVDQILGNVAVLTVALFGL